MPQNKFTPSQAEELAAAFAAEREDYLFIGKSGAILLGYPETTQASKRATGREKDLSDVPRLEEFRVEYDRRRDS